MREIEEKAARAYEERFGEEPDLVASAPGRINLIGEYTDFNGGFVLACAIERLAGEELKRARHVVRENARVLEAVRALRGRDFAGFGRLMYASHLSLRNDFEVSIPELDAFVDATRESGSLGARLTGAGFGGCAVALVSAADTGALASSARRAFEKKGFGEPAFYEFRPAAGAEVVG